MRQEQEPPSNRVDEVADGVLRVQLPVEIEGLGHVNTYLIPDRRGVAVVDPGMPTRRSRNALVHRLGLAGFRPSDVHTVIVTHSHPDHFGGARWLADEASADVWAHAAFRLSWMPDPCDAHVHDVDPDDAPPTNPHAAPPPWGGRRFRPPLRHRLLVRPRHPRPRRRLRHGDVVELGGRPWVAIHTPGHTLDHLCLADPEHGVLISGDHLLPTITPHIPGVGAGRDPMAAFLSSLDRILALPTITTALPAHGHPFGGVQDRVRQLQDHHRDRLDALCAAVRDLGTTTVVELTDALFPPRRRGPFAESEVYAHMQYLCRSGVLVERVEDGVPSYSVAC